MRDALGAACRIVGVDRLRGGSKKGVYRIRLKGAETASVIVCRWADGENFWPGAAEDDRKDPFAPASGLVPFRAARHRLEEIGARVPHLLLADHTKQRYAADIAVVEDIPGGTLEALFGPCPARSRPATPRSLHAGHAPFPGGRPPPAPRRRLP